MANFVPNKDQLDNAKTVFAELKSLGYNDTSACAILGNLQWESGMNAGQSQVGGGGGYGLGQWTPKENLYTQAATVGLSNAEAETVKGQAQIIGQGDKTGQWMDSVSSGAYISGAIDPLTLANFKKMTDINSATLNFETHWERGLVSSVHMEERQMYATAYYKILNGTDPDNGGGSGGDNGSSGSLLWLDSIM